MDLTDARAAYDGRAWQRAYDAFAGAESLEAADLDRFAVAAMMLGRLDDYFAIRERAYHQLLGQGDLAGAAMAAGWIGAQRMVQGEVAVGGGWLARADRIASQLPAESTPRAFQKLSQGMAATFGGDFDAGAALASEAAELGLRLGDRDLFALATHQRGLTLLMAGRAAEGLACLDEAMVAVTADELSPMITGIVYCGALHGCWSVYELQRAQQWTAAMASWCDSQPDLANFTGECKVRRAELKQLRGQWALALDELEDVTPADVSSWASGTAAYVRGNLDRLQGRFDSAEECFAMAARLGVDPQPGLAQLRLVKGSVQAAAAMLRRSLAEVDDVGRRIEILIAAPEILLAVGDHEGASATAAELAELAEGTTSQVVRALVAQVRGEVDTALGRPESALPQLRSALRIWLTETAPYQEALTRELVATCCEALGDHESARRERDTARALYDQLGALPDLTRLAGGDDVLTSRELEVLRLVATGATNRAIAEQLVLSERTVDRHVSNIFTKLGVSTRAAATAYAFARELV